MDNEQKGFTIDLEQIVAAKFKGKKLPGFVISFLKRFLHVDMLNEFFARGHEGIEFCREATKYLGITLDVEGLENLPADGSRCTVVCNHPLGGIDGVSMAGLIGGHFGEVSLPVNDFLMAVPGLRPLGIPINKVGGQARNLPELIREAFAKDRPVLIFPAGLCSRKIDGKVQDLPWTKTFITHSVSNGRTIIPVHFKGRNSARFYRLARLRKWLRIKFNIEMITLPDELYKARGKTFKVVIGKPIPPETFDSSKTPLQWAAWVRGIVYEL